MNLTELGAFICEALMTKDIDVVLSGGSCVEIYSQGTYTSYDLDFINRYNESKKKISEVMFSLGFTQENRYYIHDDIKYLIEFPPGPLGVGDAPVNEVNKIKTETGVLRLLSPTDCIKDRLAAYYHWNDEQSLQQAIWITEKNKYDLDSIKKWSDLEGMSEKYNIFLKSI
jgi:hypothetical protein